MPYHCHKFWHDELDVDAESTVLDVVTKWALHPGRSIETVDKVMPLVGFALVDSLTSPNPELQELMKKSTVVSELWQEAITLQTSSGSLEGVGGDGHGDSRFYSVTL